MFSKKSILHLEDLTVGNIRFDTSFPFLPQFETRFFKSILYSEPPYLCSSISIYFICIYVTAILTARSLQAQYSVKILPGSLSVPRGVSFLKFCMFLFGHNIFYSQCFTKKSSIIFVLSYILSVIYK